MSTFSNDDDLDKVWEEIVARCDKITTWNIKDKPPTIDQIIAKISTPKHGKAEDKNIMKEVFEKTLICIQRFGAIAANTASVLFGPSYQCFNAVNLVIEAIQDYENVFSDITALMERISCFLEKLRIYLEDASAGIKLDKRLRPSVYKVLEQFLFIMGRVHKLTSGRRGKLKLAAKIAAFGDDTGVKDALTKLETLVADVTSTEITVILKDLSAAARDIRSVDQRLEEMSISQKVDSQRLETMMRLEQERADRDSVNRLSRVDDASFDSASNSKRRQCVENTRVEYLDRIIMWATKPSSQSIFWLRGVAGTGKSTIAKTVAYSLRDNQKLHVTSFFFSRGTGDGSKTNKLLWTIAYQLSVTSKELRHYIGNQIEQDERLCRSSAASEQLDKLILRPLRQWREDKVDPTVIILILDALDECDDHEEVLSIVELIGSISDLEDIGLRILLTSRPDVELQQTLRTMDGIGYEELALRDEYGQTYDKDIRTFLLHELNQVQRLRAIPGVWPSETELRILVQKSAGLFIFAATACAFIKGSKLTNPAKRLNQICQDPRGRHKSTLDLDRMYMTVLESVLRDVDDDEDTQQEIVIPLRQVLGALAALSDNISVPTLEALLDIEADHIVRSLQAVVYIDSRGFIRLIHESFRDFLLDKTRCIDSRFAIDGALINHELSSQCLRIMKENLRENICGLASAGADLSELSQDGINDNIPPVVRYACFYWVSHIVRAGSELGDQGEIHLFLKTFSLCYLETMGLIGGIFQSPLILEMLNNRITTEQGSELHALSSELMVFNANFSNIIAIAPLQVYYVAAYFSPVLSHMLNFDLLFQSVTKHSVLSRVSSTSSSCQLTLESNSDGISKVLFAEDGSKVILGLNQELQVWNVKTGQCLHKLLIPFKHEKTIDLLQEGRNLVSLSSRGTVCVWDMQRGVRLKGYRCPNSPKILLSGLRVICGYYYLQEYVEGPPSMLSLERAQKLQEFQFEGDCVGLAIDDEESILAAFASVNHRLVIFLLDIETLEEKNRFEDENGEFPFNVKGRFSPDGFTLALGGDHSERWMLWNWKTGKLQQTLECTPGDNPSVAFSADGSLMATGSGRSIYIWEVKTARCKQLLRDPKETVITDIAFSPNGLSLISGSRDGIARIWEIRADENTQINKEGDSGGILRMTLSPDKMMLASISTDRTVRLWDVETQECKKILDDPPAEVENVFFSADGMTLMSYSRFPHSVQIWDVETGNCLQRILEVARIALSPDRSILVIWFIKDTIQVLDLKRSEHSDLPQENTVLTKSFVFPIQHPLWADAGKIRDRSKTLDFSEDGSKILMDLDDRSLTTVDVKTGVIKYIPSPQRVSTRSNISRDGSTLAVYDGISKALLKWDPQKEEWKTIPVAGLNDVLNMTLSPDGAFIFLVDPPWAGTINSETGERLQVASPGLEDTIYRVFSADGSKLIARSGRVAGIRIWDAKTGVCLHTWHSRAESFQDLALEYERRNSSAWSPAFEIEGERGDWLTVDSKRAIWLPPDYRPSCGCVYTQDTLIIGSASGRITFFKR